MEEKLKKIFKNLSSFFEKLSSEPVVGGLHITNSSIQYLSFREGEESPVYFSVQIPPGVIERGRVQDPKGLYDALMEISRQITEYDSEDRIKAVVSLPSEISFTQNFSIPNVGRDRLDESAALNLQMISPIPAEEAYMSWQLISESPEKFGLLGAFADRGVVDRYKQVLRAAGFHVIAMEFPSLSLSWAVNRILGPQKESMLIVNVSSDGIDIFLLRNGYIYFDYFESWRSVQRGNQQVESQAFDRAITENIRKVMNFTSSHFHEDLKYAYFIAPGLEERIRGVIESNFNLQVAPLQNDFVSLGPAWFTVVGSAIRAGWERGEDRFISLGTEKVEKMYYREQAIDFIRKWRDIFAVACFSLIIIFVGSAFLINLQPGSLRERLEGFDVQAQEEELGELRERADKFNSLVESIEEVRGQSGAIPAFLEELRTLSDSHNITIDSVGIPSIDQSINMTARAPDSNTVIRFKNALIEHPRFESVTLPFGDIINAEGGFVSFDISFEYNIEGEAQEEEEE